jgi:hypothetical protein
MTSPIAGKMAPEASALPAAPRLEPIDPNAARRGSTIAWIPMLSLRA